MPPPPEPDDLPFASLLACHPDVLWMSSADGQRLLYCSDAFASVYGSPTSALREQPSLWLDVVHPDDRALVESASQDLLRNGSARVTYRILRPDGEVRWIDDRKVRCDDGTVAGSFLGGIARDVTDSMQADQLARLQQDILQRVAMREDRDAILVALCRQLERIVPDAIATILLLDEQRLLRVAAAPGCPPELAAAIDGLVPGDNVGSCGTAAFTGAPCIVNDTATDPRWASMREAAERFGIRSCWSYPVRTGGDGVVGTIAISSRVDRVPTEFQLALLAATTQLTGIVVRHDRAQQELVAAMEAARSATRIKNELLANVSHELRTPLAAMLGFSELALETQCPEQTTDCLRTIRSNGEHLLKVINDLLDIAKVEAGRLEIETHPCSLRQILDETVRLFERPLRERGLELVVEGAERLPASTRTDPTRVRQILVNLISNATKFTETGGVTIRCAVERVDRGRVMLEFSIADSGIGMTPEQLGRVFTPFSQADASTTRRFGGTGLGLSLSRQLARLLDGEISVESEAGRGSTFTLRFPAELDGSAREQRDPRHDDNARAAHEAATAAAKLPIRVLVAEDTASLQRLVQAVLSRAGAEVVVVEDGAAACREALAAEQAAPFDLVLMDMQMPLLDGYAATRSLREQGFTRPIVALTARAQDRDREECLQAGCTAYLSKPLRIAELVRTVAELTGHRRSPA